MADVMFVKMSLFVTMYCSIKFLTIEHMPNCTDNKLGIYLKMVKKIYYRGSMVVKTVLMDVGFNKIIHDLMENVIFNVSTSV